MEVKMDVSKLCRSCMEEMAPWECENYDQKTLDMFIFCTNIEISKEDKLPKHFCYNCSVFVESCYTYIKKAKRVNSKLKKLVYNGNGFVENFLNRTNSLDRDKVPDGNIISNFIEPDKINSPPHFKAANDEMDHDIFDDDDDKCLAEIKNKNLENEIKTEPMEESDCNEVKAEIVADTDINRDTKSSFKSKKCKICKKIFSTKGWYLRHMKKVHSNKGEGKTVGDVKKTENKEGKKVIQETGEPKNEIKCRVCEKMFTCKASRTKHLNDEHSQSIDGQKVFLCPYCPKTFPKYYHMYYHATSHPGAAKHECKTCGKVYRIRKELDQHKRTHLKDRPFACDRCDMRFKIKGILVTHLKWHDGVRPYLCSICGRSFIQSGNLESHMRVHTGEQPFACSLCSFRSSSRVSLARHERRHRGERNYPCPHCPKRFYESCSLKRHLRSHTRERPYRCPYCSRDFYDSGKRRRHFMMTHKMAPEEIPPMSKDGGPIERTHQNSARKQNESRIQCE